jgi:hypothetical protein
LMLYPSILIKKMLALYKAGPSLWSKIFKSAYVLLCIFFISQMPN